MNPFNLQAHRIPGFRHLAIIPENSTQHCTIRRPIFLGIKSPFPTTHRVRVEYHIEKESDKPESDYVLRASFKKVGANTTFINRKIAELWFGKRIEVSELVNTRISHLKSVRAEKSLHCHTCGRVFHKSGIWEIKIPESALAQGRIPPLKITVECELCGNKARAEFYQKYENGDVDIKAVD